MENNKPIEANDNKNKDEDSRQESNNNTIDNNQYASTINDENNTANPDIQNSSSQPNSISAEPPRLEPIPTLQNNQVNPSQQQTATPQKQASDPGQTLGILSLVFAFLFPLVGLVLGIIGHSKSKKAGYKNGLSVAGIVLSIVFMVLTILFFILVFGLGIWAFNETQKICDQYGPGEHYVNGTSYNCGGSNTYDYDQTIGPDGPPTYDDKYYDYSPSTPAQ